MKEFAGLERHVQKRVVEALDKFEHTSAAGAHLEKLNHGRDARLKTMRIDKFYRGVVLAPEQGSSFLLLKVLPHDDAIDWALTHRASLNAATQGIEIRDDLALERLSDGLRKTVVGSPATAALLAHVSDADLRRLGIDEAVLVLSRQIHSEELLDSTRPFLPEHQYDVLCGLAAGMSPEQVWQEVVQVQLAAGQEAEAAALAANGDVPDDLTAAMNRAQGRIALVSGPAELMELLERPFDTWRIFLHPSQRRIAYRSAFSGPARVAGGPGTGKTVVALHRAAHLAARLPKDAPDGAVLLTTFTRDLAAELERSIRLLVTDPEQSRRIRVVNVDAFAYEVVREQRGKTKLNILTDQREIAARWSRAAKRLNLNLTDAFLDQEWRHVFLAQDLESAESYLKASRAGRGAALGPLQRGRVWRAVEAFTAEVRQEDRYTVLQLNAAAARILNSGAAAGEQRRFRHVVVDEAQDLHPAQWRLLRASVAEGANDLFLAGDTHQRIYGNKVSLRSLGIPVAGRSFQLRINYRSTHEIAAWAVSLLTRRPGGVSSANALDTAIKTPPADQPFFPDDMDGGLEGLDGYRSTFHGAEPLTQGYPNKAEELQGLACAIGDWIAAGVEPGEIGVGVRVVQLGRDLAAALKRKGIDAVVLTGDTVADGAGVRIGTMHRMKGLEFRCMAVAGVSEGIVPMRSAVTAVEIDAQQHQEDLQTELGLLFVASTRAREVLRVSWHGDPSSFLG
ncbi:UvrD-helicase domain-containing protein [Streptacidiphilus carbonis]|uniref:UvrD-helicase domain-containing protein n=1 Tax=Streptacidiphilus carbonis TaxID=105422 RepID=UPI00191BD9C3|nr:UvrD-helicase domain-containing protein [Streptacidiphilus carbonis]